MGWIIVAAMVLLIAGLLMLRVCFIVSYDGAPVLSAGALGIYVRIYPRRRKKVRLHDYKIKRFRRLEMKRKKKQAQKVAQKTKKKLKREAEKQAETAGQQTEAGKKRGTLATVKMFIHLIQTVLKKFFGYLRVDVYRFRIIVGEGDAAKTAIVYGTVAQSAAYLFEILKNAMDFRVRHPERVTVDTDFLAEHTTFDVKIRFSLCVWQALAILMSAALGYIRQTVQKPS